MQTRRQQKVARVVKEAVSDAVANRLSDPRISGFVSITNVEMAPDLRNANVYLSIFGGNETAQKKTFLAIEHAKRKIQSLLGQKIKSKFCPVLHFYMDEKFKKTMKIINLINKTTAQTKEADSEQT